VPTSEARIATPQGARYLGQLCKHFAHKLPVTLEERHGRIDFAAGSVVLDATSDTLLLRVEAADAERLARVQDVVARHLERFAFRAPVAIEWVD